MKQITAVLFITIILVCPLAANKEIFDAAEELRTAGDKQGALTLLEDGLSSTSSNVEKAEYCWRIAEIYLNMGDDLGGKAESEEIMTFYEKGEFFANRALEADPSNHTAYFMKSANIGRWGQTKGILSSLFKMGDMKEILILALRQKEDYSSAWDVLAMLYGALPGRPLSFGNIEYAVSLSRKAYDTRIQEIRQGDEEEMGVGIRKVMALHLWDRDWSSSKRLQKQRDMQRKFDRESDLFKKNLYYEGTITIPAKDDREEAIEIMKTLKSELEARSGLSVNEEGDLREIRKILEEWD